ncbi:hypothetical protein AALP_AAs44396U000100 [Arabis alpina]|uniref:Retrotransposon Copia-like N-terminal domain-containing protein n=1 Tax=Arabis alpina TaxID=50452 RepID=A0A087FXF1_ARAAL|nr:hypothetical protein AALP_AAs44396U000100 [Arabis alpina]
MTSSPAETIDTTSSLLNINMSNITKITSVNYLTWKLQIHALLDGYALAGHVEGSAPPPAATLTTDNHTAANPSYTKWVRQDKLLYSALLGTMSPSIQALVSRTKTSAEIWQTVAATYANPSRGHVQQLNQQLEHFKKGDKTIDEYLQGLTTRFDQLALLGKPLDHDDQIDSILRGLPAEYKTIANQMEGRDVAPTITELHEKLLTKEAKVLALHLDIVPVSANIATARPRSYQGKQQQRQPHTKDQLADALTKPLSRARFIELRNKIGVTHAPPS